MDSPSWFSLLVSFYCVLTPLFVRHLIRFRFSSVLGYWVALLAFSIIAMSNGNRNIWTTPINEANFDEKSPQNFNAPSNHVYPPQQQNLMQSSHVPTAPQYQGPPV